MWNAALKLEDLIEDEVFSPTLIANELRTHKSEIARTLGMKDEALTRASRVRSKKTQTLLREMLEIVHRVERRTGSPLVAYAWFRSERIPGFGGMTADRLVREGKANHVRAYLDHVDNGGYA